MKFLNWMQDIPGIGRLMPQSLQKGVADAQWANPSGMNQLGNVSMEAANTAEKSLTPRQSYELSIAVNAAVRAITQNISKAKWRFFLRDDGREITGGQLVNLFKKPAKQLSMRQWLSDNIAWYNISGEFCSRIGSVDQAGFPTSLIPLNPYNLQIQNPSAPRFRSDVRQWRYTFNDGYSEDIRGDYLLSVAMFNPNDSVRGLSPLITGGIEVASAYASARYRKNFFDNNAIPSHVITLPEGTPRAVREDFTSRYLSEFSSYLNHSHKVMVAVGKDVKIQKLQDPPQDGAFMDLSKWSNQQVAMLYRVPAIEMGLYDKTRFDTAKDERKLFVESTLMPQMDVMADAVQIQIVDPFFSLSDYTTDTPDRLTKSLADRFERRREESDESRIICILDADAMPIMASVKADQVAAAKDMRDALFMSPKEVADYFNIDIADRPEREDIYMLNNYYNITRPAMNQAVAPNAGKGPGESAKENGRPLAKSVNDTERARLKTFQTYTRRLRKLTLSSLDDGKIWPLASADELDGADDFRRPIRVIRHQLKAVLDQQDPKAAAKEFFNKLDGKALLGIDNEN